MSDINIIHIKNGENTMNSLLLLFLACGDKDEDTATSEPSTEEPSGEPSTEEPAGEPSTEEPAGEPSEEPAQTAKVRVVHLSPDAPEVDVYINGEASGITAPFPAGTGYVDLEVGDYEFAVAPTGTDYASIVPTVLDTPLTADTNYTAIAHGYLDAATNNNGNNAFAITAFVDDSAEITEGNFKVQVIHAAAGDAFAEVDIWNLTDADAAAVLIPDFAYGSATTTELPTGVAYVLGFDLDNDPSTVEATFTLPDTITGFVGLYAANDTDGNPFLFAHFEDGTTAQIDPDAE